MDDVRAVPPNGLALVSLFSGCGGSCLGFRQAGFRTLFANEFVPAAADSYRANAADVPLDVRDIRDVRASDVFDVIGHGTQIDVLEGSPPCASFSVAGRLQRGWNAVRDYSDTKQRTDDLFFEFARLLRELRPRVFVAENVAGLLRGVARGFFKDIFRTLQSCGYRVRVELADAQWLGVPQHRERTIFVGVREDLRRDPVFPRPLPYRYSVRDACPHVVRMQHTGIRWRPATLPASTIVASGGTVTPTAQMSGGSFVEVLNARGRVERRRLTIPELRRICTFPEDFVLTGSASQQWERLGRSVPPTMARAFARELAELLS
jgi:DNA (cytosine-5)-methyltransferase 1